MAALIPGSSDSWAVVFPGIQTLQHLQILLACGEGAIAATPQSASIQLLNESGGDLFECEIVVLKLTHLEEF